jgi:hypothetical protein
MVKGLMMVGLSSELTQRCRNTLLKCGEFNSDAALRAVFVTDELYSFRDRLPVAGNKSERVDKCLEFLLDKRLSNGRPVLPIFLAALRDRYQEGDALRDELGALAEAVQSTLVVASDLPPIKRDQADIVGKPTSDQNGQTRQYLAILAGAVVGFLTGVMGNLLAAWIQRDVLCNSFTLINIISIIVLTAVGLVVGVLLQR